MKPFWISTLLILLVAGIAQGKDAATCTEDDAPLRAMLRISSLLYNFTDLRKFVLAHGATYNKDLSPAQKKKKGIVEFNDPSNIITRNLKPDESYYEGTLLKDEITPKEILKFLEENKSLISYKNGEITVREESDDSMEAIESHIESLKEFTVDDSEIVEFDDEFVEFGSTDLVFAVIVNRSQQRITVAFRGSAAPKDFLIDALAAKSVPPPSMKDFTIDGVKVHYGFKKYLFGKTTSDDGSKFFQILNVLDQVYKNDEYKNYELYVTGHSLGGCLSHILAFTLAGSSKADFIPKPITAITFCAPEVGDKKFNENFQKLEKEGKLRNIRVSNHGDIFGPWLSKIGFKQQGLNIHLYNDKKAVVGYNNFISFWLNPIYATKYHSRAEIDQRLFDSGMNDDLLDMSVDELYKVGGYEP